MTGIRASNDVKMRQTIAAEQMKLLNQNIMFSIPANFICYLIVFTGIYKNINHKLLYAWFITALFFLILQASAFIVDRIYTLPKKYYSNFLIVVSCCHAALWGLSGSVLMPEDNLLSQMLVIMVIIGVTSGGLHTLQPSLAASFLFFTIMILPLSTWLFLQNTLTHFLLGIALFIFLCFVSIISWMGNKLLTTNFKLRYKSLDLAHKLSINNKIMKESESRFRSAFSFAAIGMALVSLEGRWLKVNQSLCQLLGYSEEELLKTDFQTITYPEDLAVDLNKVQLLLAGRISSYHLEKRYIKKDGSILWILLSGSLIRDSDKQPLYFIAQIQDIDARKKAEEELKYLAYHDALTGLANRKQLDASFELALSFAKRQKNQIAILFMDLDHFKEINDNLGHDIGDLLLIEIGARLKKTIRTSDILIRQGGDEFLIALTEVTSSEKVIEVAKKILIAITTPVKIKSHKILITGSIGISIYPKDGQDLNTLVKAADNALYVVKEEGRNNFRFAE